MTAKESWAEPGVVWHDLECGGYAEDLELWRELAAQYGSPILDVGAGTGRVSLDLARRGHRVVAIDNDAVLAAELGRRAGDLDVDVEVVVGDARYVELDQRFALCLVPMQTIQLLGGPEGREQFLRRAHGHLIDGGLLAVAIAQTLDLYDIVDDPAVPLPDICELEGVVYSSQPTAVRVERSGFVLERRRDIVSGAGDRTETMDVIRLDRVSASALAREGESVGLRSIGFRSIPPTSDYAGSEVVMLGR